ncbi:hypothetical protein L7F22_049454 [Adiantum nelumboides]|nr:hypothetical protein [Adiantum nelumboides]
MAMPEGRGEERIVAVPKGSVARGKEGRGEHCNTLARSLRVQCTLGRRAYAERHLGNDKLVQVQRSTGAIKKELHYNQETLDTLSFFKDIGANVGIISGLMNDVLPAWTVLIVDALMKLLGYLMIWLAVTHRVARPPTWEMNLFICAGANSQTFANTGVMVTFVKTFPLVEDTRGAIFLIALLPSVVTFIFVSFIRRIMTHVYEKHEKHNFYMFLYLAFLIDAFLSIAIIVENVGNIPTWHYKAFGAMSLLFVISNIAIGVRAELAYKKQMQRLESTA